MSKHNQIKKVFCSVEGVAIDRRSSHAFYQPSCASMQRLAVVIHRMATTYDVRPALTQECGWVATRP